MKKIVICGSMTFTKEMLSAQKILADMGYIGIVPGNDSRDLNHYKESGNTKEAIRRKIDNNYILEHFQLIDKCDAVLILNLMKNDIENYIGGNSFLEMGHAFGLNKRILLLNPVPMLSYSSEIAAMQPTILNNDIASINI